MAVAWDYTHQEFTITDHYFFSTLQRECAREGIQVDEVRDWRRLGEYEVIVFNYPERPFTDREVEEVAQLVEEEGKRVILLGYYKNEDGVADACNSLAARFGLHLNPDVVLDGSSNHQDDPYFVVTSRVYRFNQGIRKVLLPCTSSVRLTSGRGEPLIEAEPTARSDKAFPPILAASYRSRDRRGGSRGEFILLGTCVFWSNHSIDLYDNRELALNLLRRG